MILSTFSSMMLFGADIIYTVDCAFEISYPLINKSHSDKICRCCSKCKE